MSLKLITFKTNHTILGNTKDEGDTIKITQPVQVIPVPAKSVDDYAGIAFSPFVQYCEEFETGITIQKSDILTTTTPITELANQYNKYFGSGIQIASSISNL